MAGNGAPLSPREREVLDLVAEGHTQREVALVLGISRSTVSVHVGRIGSKLGMSHAPMRGLLRRALHRDSDASD